MTVLLKKFGMKAPPNDSINADDAKALEDDKTNGLYEKVEECKSNAPQNVTVIDIAPKDKEWIQENCTFSVETDPNDKRPLLKTIVIWIARTTLGFFCVFFGVVLTIVMFCCCSPCSVYYWVRDPRKVDKHMRERFKFVWWKRVLILMVLITPPIIDALFYLGIDGDDIRSIEAVAPLLGSILFLDYILIVYHSIIDICVNDNETAHFVNNF